MTLKPTTFCKGDVLLKSVVSPTVEGVIIILPWSRIKNGHVQICSYLLMINLFENILMYKVDLYLGVEKLIFCCLCKIIISIEPEIY